MKLTKSYLCGMVVCGCFALAVEARADNCSGYDVLVNQSGETLDVGGGQTLFVGRNHSVNVDNDANGKANLTIGECNGTFLSSSDGKSRGAGYCLRKDQDGDTYSVEWAMAPGAEKGTWKINPGTGKFSKASGTGWWQNAVASGKVFVTRWGGNCNW